jgi:hypothetical protein
MMHFLHHFSALLSSSILRILFLFSFFSSYLFAEQNSWELYHVKVYIENDLVSEEDSQYTGGTKIDVVYKINNPGGLYNLLFSDDSKTDLFRSFAVASQVYTPADLTKSEPIYSDWSYAAWTYIEVGAHKSTDKKLNSLLLRVGMVGPDAEGKEVQSAIHKWTGSTKPEGWDNQLYNELGINITYIYKERYEYTNKKNYGISFVPSFEADVGNISTQASLGMFMRTGYNISKDFGVSTMSVGGESGIPAYTAQKLSLKKSWSWSFNMAFTGSAVARDIFVEGNTFRKSIVVHQRKNFVAYVGAGFTIRYKSFNLDFMETYNTPKAKDIDRSKIVGTLLLTYLY